MQKVLNFLLKKHPQSAVPSGGGAVGVHAVIFGSMDIVNYYADLGIEDDHADEVGY